MVGEAAETGISRNGDVPSAPSHKDMGTPRAWDGPLQGLHVAHDVQKLSQPPCQLGTCSMPVRSNRPHVPALELFYIAVLGLLGLFLSSSWYWLYPPDLYILPRNRDLRWKSKKNIVCHCIVCHFGSLRHIKLSFLFVVMHGKVYMRHKKKAQAPSAVPDGEQLANKSG